jgi:uncharacterized protein YndB with AHSA1/START domain
MRSTKTSRVIKAPRPTIYRAFLDADSVVAWLAPNNMTGHLHTFEPREGGKFRMSLTYIDPKKSPAGKTSENTDTFQARFVKLVPNETIVQAVEFESQEPGYAGEMTITWTLKDVSGGTEVTVLFEGIPEGVRLEDNELGSQESLQKLAAFVER